MIYFLQIRDLETEVNARSEELESVETGYRSEVGDDDVDDDDCDDDDDDDHDDVVDSGCQVIDECMV